MDCSLPGSSVHGDSPGKKAGVGCYSLIQWIFPTQGSNLGLPHCRTILYHLSQYLPANLQMLVLWLSPQPNSHFVPPTVEASGNLGQNNPGGMLDFSFYYYYSPHRIHQHLDAPSKYIQNLTPSPLLPATSVTPSHVICCWISAVTQAVYISCPTTH